MGKERVTACFSPYSACSNDCTGSKCALMLHLSITERLLLSRITFISQNCPFSAVRFLTCNSKSLVFWRKKKYSDIKFVALTKNRLPFSFHKSEKYLFFNFFLTFISSVTYLFKIVLKPIRNIMNNHYSDTTIIRKGIIRVKLGDGKRFYRDKRYQHY